MIIKTALTTKKHVTKLWLWTQLWQAIDHGGGIAIIVGENAFRPLWDYQWHLLPLHTPWANEETPKSSIYSLTADWTVAGLLLSRSNYTLAVDKRCRYWEVVAICTISDWDYERLDPWQNPQTGSLLFDFSCGYLSSLRWLSLFNHQVLVETSLRTHHLQSRAF